MGTLSREVVNVFVILLEPAFITTKINPKTWFRYVDDMFMIFCHTGRSQIRRLHNNSNHHPR